MYDKHTTCGILTCMSTHLTRINDPFPTTGTRRHPSQHSPNIATVSYVTRNSNKKKYSPGPTTYRHRRNEKYATTVVLDAVSVTDAGGAIRREFLRTCVELNEQGFTLIVLDDGKDRPGYLDTGLERLTFDGAKTRSYRHATDRAEMVAAIERGLGDIDASKAVFVTRDPLTLEDAIDLGCMVWLCPDSTPARSATAMKTLFGVNA